MIITKKGPTTKKYALDKMARNAGDAKCVNQSISNHSVTYILQKKVIFSDI